MNAEVSQAQSKRRIRRRSSAVARGWCLTAALLASSALLASAQLYSTESMRGNPPAQQFVSTNRLLTPAKAQQATERAHEALLRGRYEEAQKQVKRALDIYPNCAIALALQGVVKIQGKDYAEAAQTFQQAINADPTLGAAYLGLGQTYNMLGRFKEALVPLDRAVAILPAAWPVRFETAVARLGIGDPEAGLKEITHAERMNGTDRQSRSALSYLRALAHLQLKDYSRARADLEEAIKHHPNGEYAMLAQKRLAQLSPLITDGR